MMVLKTCVLIMSVGTCQFTSVGDDTWVFKYVDWIKEDYPNTRAVGEKEARSERERSHLILQGKMYVL